MRKPTSWHLLILTPIFIIIAHDFAIFAHEYAHSFMAWALGDKLHPLAITFGGTSWINLLLFIHIDENVDYNAIISHGHLTHMAIIALAGPVFANGSLYIVTLLLLSTKTLQRMTLWFYFIFWINLMKLGNLYDYIPIRTFSPNDDMAHVVMGFQISAWKIYVFAGYVVAILIWYFYTHTLIQTYRVINLKSTTSRATLMIICTAILFGYFGMAGFIGHGDISHFLSATSFCAIPGIIIACWPTREWVKRALLHQQR